MVHEAQKLRLKAKWLGGNGHIHEREKVCFMQEVAKATYAGKGGRGVVEPPRPGRRG